MVSFMKKMIINFKSLLTPTGLEILTTENPVGNVITLAGGPIS